MEHLNVTIKPDYVGGDNADSVIDEVPPPPPPPPCFTRARTCTQSRRRRAHTRSVQQQPGEQLSSMHSERRVARRWLCWWQKLAADIPTLFYLWDPHALQAK